jgi:cation/acetate symporter
LCSSVFFPRQDPSDYYAAGRKITGVGSGKAIASNWMSAASVLGLAGMMYGFGYNGLAYVVGWTGGYVSLLVLMAAQIRKYGKYTAPDLSATVLFQRSSHPQCNLHHPYFFRILRWAIRRHWAHVQMGIGTGLHLVGDHRIIGCLLYTLISGMIGATKNMQVQYVYHPDFLLLPTFILSFKFDYFWLLPQLGYGSVVTDIVQGIPAPISIMVHPSERIRS